MGLIALPVAFALLLAWAAVAIIVAMVPVALLKPFPLGRVLGPLFGVAMLPLVWYLPNASGLSEQGEFDKITDCGLVVLSVAESVDSIFIETDALFDTQSSFDDLKRSYAAIDYRNAMRTANTSDASSLPAISSRFGLRIQETSTDKLVRREEQVVDRSNKTVLAKNVSYRPISSPDMSGPVSVAMYHLTYQPTVCKGTKIESPADWLPKVLKPAGGGGKG